MRVARIFYSYWSNFNIRATDSRHKKPTGANHRNSISVLQIFSPPRFAPLVKKRSLSNGGCDFREATPRYSGILAISPSPYRVARIWRESSRHRFRPVSVWSDRFPEQPETDRFRPVPTGSLRRRGNRFGNRSVCFDAEQVSGTGLRGKTERHLYLEILKNDRRNQEKSR
jgi:hypothetical protein